MRGKRPSYRSLPGVDATVNIAPIDAAGATPLQQWLYGSDHRIYLHVPGSTPAFCIDFVNPAENFTPLRR